MTRWRYFLQTIKGVLNRFSAPSRLQETPSVFYFDDRTLDSLARLAQHQGCSCEQIAAELLRQALARRHSAETSLRAWSSLTPREQQVAALVCSYFTNQEIASYLGISPETVKSHIQSVFHKFNLRRRTELRLALADWDFSAWVSN
jgi:DNA-binding CsgD family transcriptional regulator